MSKPILLVRFNIANVSYDIRDSIFEKSMRALNDSPVGQDYHILGVPETLLGRDINKSIIIEVHTVCDSVDVKTIEELQKYIEKVIKNE